MKRKLIYGVAFILIFFISATVIFSASKQKTAHPESTPCKESMQDCCKKEGDKEQGSQIDFESLSGKFFSSVLIN